MPSLDRPTQQQLLLITFSETMRFRPLGQTGLTVSEFGLGCSSLGGGVFYKNDAESLRVLKLALDRGINFYDTADNYGFGHSEELLGRAFRGKRDKVIIASKVGQLPTTLGRFGKITLPVVGPFRSVINPLAGPLRKRSKHRHDFSQDHICRAIDRTLGRLKTDYVDIYLLHSPPREVLEEGDVFETLEELRRAGKIRFYGVSTRTIEDARFCLANPSIPVIQTPFNLIERGAAENLFPLLQHSPVGVIARVPLARGLLTSRQTVTTGLTTGDRRLSRLAAEERQRLRFLVRQGGRTFLQAALQFVLFYREVSTVIPGTRSVRHLEEILSASEAAPLQTWEIEQVFSCAGVAPTTSLERSSSAQAAHHDN